MGKKGKKGKGKGGGKAIDPAALAAREAKLAEIVRDDQRIKSTISHPCEPPLKLCSLMPPIHRLVDSRTSNVTTPQRGLQDEARKDEADKLVTVHLHVSPRLRYVIDPP